MTSLALHCGATTPSLEEAECKQNHRTLANTRLRCSKKLQMHSNVNLNPLMQISMQKNKNPEGSIPPLTLFNLYSSQIRLRHLSGSTRFGPSGTYKREPKDERSHLCFYMTRSCFTVSVCPGSHLTCTRFKFIYIYVCILNVCLHLLQKYTIVPKQYEFMIYADIQTLVAPFSQSLE